MNLLCNRWLILTMALICSATMGILYSFSVFVIPLEKMFDWDRSETILTFSLMMVFFGLGMFTGGKIMQKIGPVKTETVGGILLGAGFFLASYTAETRSLIWLYVTYGALAGYGLGMANVVPVSVALRWFPDKKGLISGLVTMFLALGTFFLGTKLSAALIDKYDVTVAFKILGVVFIVVTVISAQFFRFPKITTDTSGPACPAPTNAIWGVSTSQMLKTSTAWIIVVWCMSIQIGGLMIIGHIVPYAQGLGFPLALALLAMTAYALANGVGRLFHGWLHDAGGRRISMTVNALLMLTGLLGLAYLPDIWGFTGIWIAVVPIAMAYGGAIAHTAVLAATFFGPKYFGANFGFFAFPAVLAALIGPPLAAFIYDQSGVYQTAIVVAAAISLVGLIAAQLVKDPGLKPQE